MTVGRSRGAFALEVLSTTDRLANFDNGRERESCVIDQLHTLWISLAVNILKYGMLWRDAKYLPLLSASATRSFR